MTDKAVLAYSGGLDTSVTIRWLAERGYEVHAVVVDVGQREDFDAIARARSRRGRRDVRVVDAVERFAADFLTQAIVANGLYEGTYPMVSALARPCIAEEIVARRARGGRRHARARVHRQGQRPGAVRGVVLRARART